MSRVRNNIPLDLTIEILVRLPAKSVFRFRCVSKTWCSVIGSRQFTEAFMSMSMSMTRPHLLLGFNHSGDNRLLLFSSPHQSFSFSSSSSSMLVDKKNTLTIPKVKPRCIILRNSVRGFIGCFLQKRGFVVCNPTTRQVMVLPEDYNNPSSVEQHYLGYAPSNDQYKVLRLVIEPRSALVIEHSVCTLGGQQSSYSWRRIKSSIIYYNYSHNGVCIDGVVYYYACLKPCRKCKTVSSFDVGSEQLRLIKTPENFSGSLTNYLGKLAAYDIFNGDCSTFWVLDDVKNQVWSKRTFVFPSAARSLFEDWRVRKRFAGITAAGEIVYVPLFFSDPFELFCYDVEKKVGRRVRVEGLVDVVCDGVKCCSSTSRCYIFASVLCCHVDNIIYL